MTKGRVKLTAGTLYGTLDRLVDEDLIRRAGAEIVRGRARQYFEITEKGSGAVQLEADRLAEGAAIVHCQAKRLAPDRRSRRRPAVSFSPSSDAGRSWDVIPFPRLALKYPPRAGPII
jgi:DNA-binding PadR family transcriptional regulator